MTHTVILTDLQERGLSNAAASVLRTNAQSLMDLVIAGLAPWVNALDAENKSAIVAAYTGAKDSDTKVNIAAAIALSKAPPVNPLVAPPAK